MTDGRPRRWAALALLGIAVSILVALLVSGWRDPRLELVLFLVAVGAVFAALVMAAGTRTNLELRPIASDGRGTPRQILRIRKFVFRNIVFITAAVIGLGYLIAIHSTAGLAIWTFVAALGALLVFVWNGEIF